MNCRVAWTNIFMSQKLHWDGNCSDEDKLNYFFTGTRHSDLSIIFAKYRWK